MTHKNLSFGKRAQFAIQGIRSAWRKEASLRFQVFAAGVLVVCGLVARPPLLWCAVFVGMAALVISLELINSAVEALLDRIHPEKHEAVGFAKDCMAGAVLVASIASVFVFCCYLGSLCSKG